MPKWFKELLDFCDEEGLACWMFFGIVCPIVGLIIMIILALIGVID